MRRAAAEGMAFSPFLRYNRSYRPACQKQVVDKNASIDLSAGCFD
jgi:hypothetical protein